MELSYTDNKTIEGIYKGDLGTLELKAMPVLRPILEIDKSYQNFELTINRALTDFNTLVEDLKKMQDINSKYAETIIMGKINNILVNVKEIIHCQDIQKQNMKDAINEMVKITNSDYGLFTQEYVDQLKERLKKDEPKEVPKEPEVVYKKEDYTNELDLEGGNK